MVWFLCLTLSPTINASILDLAHAVRPAWRLVVAGEYGAR
jgi:hypothetical protein